MNYSNNNDIYKANIRPVQNKVKAMHALASYYFVCKIFLRRCIQEIYEIEIHMLQK